MQPGDGCPAWFVEATGEFLQELWQLWLSWSGKAKPLEPPWRWWCGDVTWKRCTLWPSAPVNRNNLNPHVIMLLCEVPACPLSVLLLSGWLYSPLFSDSLFSYIFIVLQIRCDGFLPVCPRFAHTSTSCPPTFDLFQVLSPLKSLL